MREVTVRCTWRSTHTIEVPDDSGPFGSADLDAVIEASGDDVTSNVAELTDWEVQDPTR